MVRRYACYDDFNEAIWSRHKTIEAAFKVKEKKNTSLVRQGYTGIYTVVAIEDDEVQPLDEWERHEYDHLMDRLIY